MNNQEQVMAVKKALDLQILIAKTKDNLSNLRQESFQEEPSAPMCEQIEIKYPQIQTTVKFWDIKKLWPTFFFLPWILIYYFTYYKKAKEENIEAIKNSQEYQNQCAAIDAEVQEKQAIANAEYQKKLDEYNNITLPEYQKALNEWTQQHNEKVSTERDILKSATAELSEHYENNKLVPLQYRDTEILQYIYDVISTSDYSVREAIEMYDRERQRRLEDERIYQQQLANQIADEQAQLLSEQNAIAEKARRDANIASVVGTVQRHNTNKMLKDAFKK